MATTGQNFVYRLVSSLYGSLVDAVGQVSRQNPSNANQLVVGASATVLDKYVADFSNDGFAKHGAASVALSGTTPKTIDLTDLTSVTASYDGDTTFATFSKLVVKNLGAGSLTIAPGASNPASIGLAGTTPTLTVPVGGTAVIDYGTTPVTVDSTHKTILITPAATTTFSIAVSGS